jgi:putative nucleotidyltransferase with HDIG domain
MKTATKFYVSLIVVAAFIAAALLFAWEPTYGAIELKTLAFLSAIAVVSEMLAYALAREGRGSIAFIPYFASILVIPGWTAVAAVGLVKCGMELFSKVERRKAIFNSSSHALSIAAGIAVYLGLGGKSFFDLKDATLSGITGEFGFIAVAAFTIAFLANCLLVTVVMSLESEVPFRSLLKQNLIPQIGGDLAAMPLIFVFAWVYAVFGPMAAFVAWVPFLGLRHVSIVNTELQRTNEELLQLMVKSIEARDVYTSGHSRRVSKYAVAIARLLGRSDRECADISTAALLHDVGKIYEKYGPILSSPGKLSAVEWATMQEHPIDGANLVNTITRLRHLVPAVRHHHENWDGTGYPERIAGEDIPLASRIIMFADTIDAMTSERPYRRPLSEADVHAELVRCRGKQFDPEITDRLLAAGVWKTLFGVTKSRVAQPKLELVDSKSA